MYKLYESISLGLLELPCKRVVSSNVTHMAICGHKPWDLFTLQIFVELRVWLNFQNSALDMCQRMLSTFKDKFVKWMDNIMRQDFIYF